MRALREVGIPCRRIKREGLEFRCLLTRRGFTWLDRFEDVSKIRRRERTEFGADQYVLCAKAFNLTQRLLADEDREHLLRDCQRGIQFLRTVERKLDVHGDNHVHIHFLHDVDAEVADKTAINKQPIANAYRGKHAGHRHARPYRLGEITFVHNPDLATLNIRSNGTKRDRQVIEVPDMRYAERQFAQQHVEFLPLNCTFRQHEFSPAHTQFKIDR